MAPHPGQEAESLVGLAALLAGADGGAEGDFVGAEALTQHVHQELLLLLLLLLLAVAVAVAVALVAVAVAASVAARALLALAGSNPK